MRYTKLQQNHCMDNRGKSNFHIANSKKACVSNELANLIYNKVEKNWVLRVKTIKLKLCKPEKRNDK